MNPAKARLLVALITGLVFGAGLVISGMTQPVKVLGFLDVTGRFDASLMLVMIGAIAVHFIGQRWAKRRSAPVFADHFQQPTRRDIDTKLVVGALL
ncbi:MAG TPA: DUF6691 family protein, partial [Polyangiales bacterium]|nr:DUF6691 family protein [Polyangiales bacterium]